MALVWTLPNPVSGGFRLDNPSRSGGVALNGQEQNVVSLAMRWRARWQVRVRTNEEVLDARQFFDGLQGKANTAFVPVFDGKRVSWPVDAQDRVLHPGFTRRKQLDGTEFADPIVPDLSEVDAEVHADAAARATTLEVRVTYGGVLQAGQFFGRLGNLYRIKSVTSGPDVDGDYVLSILPPLRVALTTGQALNFTRPTCEMRQASDDQGIGELESMRFAALNLDFVEAF